MITSGGVDADRASAGARSQLAAGRSLTCVAALTVLLRDLLDLILGIVGVSRRRLDAQRFLVGVRRLLDLLPFDVRRNRCVALGTIGGALGFVAGPLLDRVASPSLFFHHGSKLSTPMQTVN
jgi:hypothetical protein